MIADILNSIPETWELTQLDNLSLINPKLDKTKFKDELVISFVPMSAVGAESGSIDVSEEKNFLEVKKGYTAFLENDVLFAKITPCMENGKSAVVPKLIGGLGFGSTEFHVLRPHTGFDNRFLYYLISSRLFRIEAEHNMSGAVGQRRVPAPWLAKYKVPLPPYKEQVRIVEKIEELFSELDKGIESLKTANAQLSIYRQTLLKHAFEGKLTEQWRKDNPDKLDSPEGLLSRIQEERDNRYEQLLDDWKKEVESWQAKGQQYKKPSKPKPLEAYRADQVDTEGNYISLPSYWTYTSLSNFLEYVTSGSRGWAKYYSNSGATFIRAQNLKHDSLDLSDIAYVSLPEEVEGKRTLTSLGDILITITGANVTKSALVTDELNESYVSQHVALCRMINPFFSKFIFKYIISGACGRRQLEKSAYGAGKPGLNLENIKGLTVPLTTIDECNAITEILDASENIISKLEQDIDSNIKRSSLLRQSILKKAFSGKLVPQDPKDEPASELLKRIVLEKAELEAKEKADKAVARKAKAQAKKAKS